MNYSLETLRTFMAVADLLSFSAAARKMGKSQSTISTAIANFEADLNMQLFDRRGREIELTTDGRKVLSIVKEMLVVSHRLELLSVESSDNIESELSIIFSDIYHAPDYADIFHEFAKAFPHVEFEFITGEDSAVVEILRQEKAQFGMHRAQDHYPIDISAQRLPFQSDMSIYVHRQHPLAHLPTITTADLLHHRQLCLSNQQRLQFECEKIWRAPSYILLLEMAENGLGWAILPEWFVMQFGHNHLVKLKIEGFPQYIEMDLIWRSDYVPKKAGCWLMAELLQKDIFK